MSLSTFPAQIRVNASLGAAGESAARTRAALFTLTAAALLCMLPATLTVSVLKQLVIDRFGVSAALAHLFMAVNLIAAAIATPWTAGWADRAADRRSVLAACLAVNALALFAMPWIPSFELLLLVRAIEGVSHVTAVSIVMASACDWATTANRGRTMGLVGSALMMGTALGVPLGGQLGPSLVWPVGGGFATIAAVLAATLLRDAPNRTRSTRLKELFSVVRDQPLLLAPWAIGFSDRFCVGVIVSSFTLYLGQILSLTPPQIGGLMAMFMIPFALLCYPVGRLIDRSGRVWAIAAGNLAFGAAFMTYGFAPVGVLPYVMLACGFLSAMMFTPNLALCADLAPPDRRATVYAGFNLAGSLGFACGPIVGAIAQSTLRPAYGALIAYQVTFIIAGALVALVMLALLPILFRATRAPRAAA